MSAITAVPRWESPTRSVRGVQGGHSGGLVRGRHLQVVPNVPTVASGPVAGHRVTRRGRLLLTTAVTLILLSSGVAGARAAMGGGAAAVYDTVTVQSGQTLSQIAHRAYPEMAVSSAVQRVQAANDLNTSYVFGGELLRLPR